jgi:serine/threonine protein kinase
MSSILLPDGVAVNVGEEIGRGGAGFVCRGVLHERTGDRVVAIKMIGRGASDKQQQQFLKEIRKSQIIAERCEGVVAACGALVHDGQTCLIMKLYQCSLAQRLEAQGAMPPKQVLRYAVQIVRALKSVHEHGAVVLDLKPANLLFDEHDFLYISDFGISHLAEVTLTTMAASAAAGAGAPMRYMAPEQFDRDAYGRPGPAADMWGLACVLIEMLKGKPPWSGMRQVEIMMQVAMKGKAPAIPDGLPHGLGELLRLCFATQPDQRLTAGDALGMLLQLCVKDTAVQQQFEVSEMPVEAIVPNFDEDILRRLVGYDPPDALSGASPRVSTISNLLVAGLAAATGVAKEALRQYSETESVELAREQHVGREQHVTQRKHVLNEVAAEVLEHSTLSFKDFAQMRTDAINANSAHTNAIHLLDDALRHAGDLADGLSIAEENLNKATAAVSAARATEVDAIEEAEAAIGANAAATDAAAALHSADQTVKDAVAGTLAATDACAECTRHVQMYKTAGDPHNPLRAHRSQTVTAVEQALNLKRDKDQAAAEADELSKQLNQEANLRKSEATEMAASATVANAEAWKAAELVAQARAAAAAQIVVAVKQLRSNNAAAAATATDNTGTHNQAVRARRVTLAELETLSPAARKQFTKEEDWMPDSFAKECMECGSEFTFFTRRHHCRGCGHVLCYKCSKTRIVIVDSGSQDPKRVCDGCAASLEDLLIPRQFLMGTFLVEAHFEGDCARWRSTKRYADFRELAVNNRHELLTCWHALYERSEVSQDFTTVRYQPHLQEFLDIAVQSSRAVQQFLGLDGLPNRFIDGQSEIFLAAVQNCDTAVVTTSIADGFCASATAKAIMYCHGMLIESEIFDNEVNVKSQASEPAAEISGADAGHVKLGILTVRDQLASLAVKLVSQKGSEATKLYETVEKKAREAKLMLEAAVAEAAVAAKHLLNTQQLHAPTEAEQDAQANRRKYLQLPLIASDEECTQHEMSTLARLSSALTMATAMEEDVRDRLQVATSSAAAADRALARLSQLQQVADTSAEARARTERMQTQAMQTAGLARRAVAGHSQNVVKLSHLPQTAAVKATAVFQTARRRWLQLSPTASEQECRHKERQGAQRRRALEEGAAAMARADYSMDREPRTSPTGDSLVEFCADMIVVCCNCSVTIDRGENTFRDVRKRMQRKPLHQCQVLLMVTEFEAFWGQQQMEEASANHSMIGLDNVTMGDLEVTDGDSVIIKAETDKGPTETVCIVRGDAEDSASVPKRQESERHTLLAPKSFLDGSTDSFKKDDVYMQYLKVEPGVEATAGSDSSEDARDASKFGNEEALADGELATAWMNRPAQKDLHVQPGDIVWLAKLKVDADDLRGDVLNQVVLCASCITAPESGCGGAVEWCEWGLRISPGDAELVAMLQHARSEFEMAQREVARERRD